MAEMEKTLAQQSLQLMVLAAAVVAVQALLVLLVTEVLLAFTALAGVEKLKVQVGTHLELALLRLRLAA
jgi:hypothetical protein